MHQVFLMLILWGAIGLGIWGGVDLSEATHFNLTADGSLSLPAILDTYIGVVKLAFAALVAAVCIGFEGLLTVAYDMKARHPGVTPPLPAFLRKPKEWLFTNPHAGKGGDGGLPK